MNKKAVFLDRDGNINQDVGYPHSYDQIEIYPYSYEAVRKINQAGLLAVIITNQSGIGRGLIKEPELWDIHARMQRDFAARQALFNGIYYCPHHQSSRIPLYDKDCRCRKPYPGMALQAASDLGIDLARSYMIGDKVEDIQFGLNIESKPVLVLTGYGRKSLSRLEQLGISPAHVAQNLLDAVNWILEEEHRHDPL
jgi:D-glycero-D-manno-heptose 1,7-bisphosphate phosphatase